MAEESWVVLGKGQTEADGIARRENEGEDKMNINKGTDLKGLSVTQRIMSTHRKDKNGDMKRLGGPKGHTLGEARAFNRLSLNI